MKNYLLALASFLVLFGCNSGSEEQKVYQKPAKEYLTAQPIQELDKVFMFKAAECVFSYSKDQGMGKNATVLIDDFGNRVAIGLELLGEKQTHIWNRDTALIINYDQKNYYYTSELPASIKELRAPMPGGYKHVSGELLFGKKGTAYEMIKEGEMRDKVWRFAGLEMKREYEDFQYPENSFKKELLSFKEVGSVDEDVFKIPEGFTEKALQ